MKKQIAALLGLALIVCTLLAGCSNSAQPSSPSTPSTSQVSSSQAGSSSASGTAAPSSDATELAVRFGDDKAGRGKGDGTGKSQYFPLQHAEPADVKMKSNLFVKLLIDI